MHLLCLRSYCVLFPVLCDSLLSLFFFFFFNDPATTEIYTLSLHDALPIFRGQDPHGDRRGIAVAAGYGEVAHPQFLGRSEEHTSELQSHSDLVCRLLLEKKKNNKAQQLTNAVHTSATPINNHHTQ